MIRRERGFILISVYLLVTFLLISGAAFFYRVLAEARHNDRFVDGVRSFYLAESGLDQALQSLIGNANYAGIAYTALAPIGGFEIVVTQPGQPNLRRILVTGHVPDNNPASAGYQQRQLEAYAQLTDSPFQNALFTDGDIEMNGNAKTDSYNASTAPYDPAQPGSKGHVGTNSTGSGDVELKGNATVNGDAFVGVGGNPNQVIQLQGNSTISGSKVPLDTAVTLTPQTVPGGVQNSGDLILSGNQQMVLPSGTYWFTKIEIKGNAQLTVQGTASIYVTGDVKLDGNVTLSAVSLANPLLQQPNQLTLAVVGNKDVKIEGNGRLFGKVNAPQSEIEVKGNGQLFGSAIAKEAELKGNAKIHFDESTAQTYSGGAPTKTWVASWREVFNP